MKYINFLIKPASSLCNMRCHYCFYEDIAEKRSCKSMGIMSNETADILIASAFRSAERGTTVSFAFQGGEPTLAGLDYFRHFTQTAKSLCPPNVSLCFSIQTNGILIDEDWVKLFKEHDFLVGLSLDGTKDLHDLNRVDAAGKGTWTKLCRGLSLMQSHKVRVNILCVVTNQCARHPGKVYSSLKKLGVKYMQFIPCMDPSEEERGTECYSLQPDRYGDFLCQLFDLWYLDWEKGNYHSVRLFDDYVNMIIDGHPGTCATCGRCGSYFVVEGDGSIYPCDFYVLDLWNTGQLGENSLEQIAESEVSRKFLLWGQDKPGECQACRWRALCNGGCKHDWISSKDGRHNYLCPSFKKFFAHAESRLLAIARAELAARRNK